MCALIVKTSSNLLLKKYFGFIGHIKKSERIRYRLGYRKVVRIYKNCRCSIATACDLTEQSRGIASQKTCIQTQPFHRFFAEKFDRLLKHLSEDSESHDEWGDPESAKLILHITSNFYDEIKKHESVLVFFFAKWCGHCKKLKKPYADAAMMLRKANLPGIFAIFDITTDLDVADKENIVGVPVLKYFRNGKFIATYNGKRTAEDIFQFMKNPPTEPIYIKRIEI